MTSLITAKIVNDPVGEVTMDIDLRALRHLLSKRVNEIEEIVAGTGYLARTVIGVGTYLLDNHGELELLTANQRVTFDKFLLPLLESAPAYFGPNS